MEAGLSDDEALRKIGQRSSLSGKIVTLAIVLGAGGLGYFYVQRSTEYDARMDKVQLYTKAWVKRGDDIVHGDYIMYDAADEYAEVIGGGSDVASPATPGGRVRAIIQPKKKPGEATPPSAPEAPTE